ncbi:antibiotic biosynthesis monooxygenase [Burkholderia sp. MSh2]|uniref:Antibiotic biosynthesis monooxygenase n=1 Tax=Burkholderia paludis TaxID=1506587 RepID=A0A6J5D5P7_9BURK|nr:MULTISPECIES: putative quinol monooxygenase [Burkholderia]KEZ03014.1 antibiotic biosynthesis monooxygenase [Burkholderia sp. MSh2]KFG98284.1 antibiotic biosynthesis monooxygenase [Burkholderia paludis]CAB3749223.1 Putative monooxygenase [Burkholderia paludis]VWB20708.1 antibiotic biosynthesis monooxygenase [Burkholderia paludis]
MALHVIASLFVKPEHAQAAEAELRNLVARTRAEPGNRRYDLFRAQDGAPDLHLYEIYDDQAAFDAHLASPHFGEFSEKSADWFTAPPVIRVLSNLDVAG